MSQNNNALGKGKSDIYMISENIGISNNTKRKNQKKFAIGKKYLKFEVLNHQIYYRSK